MMSIIWSRQTSKLWIANKEEGMVLHFNASHDWGKCVETTLQLTNSIFWHCSIKTQFDVFAIQSPLSSLCAKQDWHLFLGKRANSNEKGVNWNHCQCCPPAVCLCDCLHWKPSNPCLVLLLSKINGLCHNALDCHKHGLKCWWLYDQCFWNSAAAINSQYRGLSVACKLLRFL